MPKKCIICSEEAEFKIKDGNEYYCQECAEDSFADLTVLQSVEEAAQLLKQVIKERINGDLQNDSDLETQDFKD
ncbi:MAG: hypothetical protein CMI53_01570 [Parcubacteria group bacterium]|nr:hypothetical protein [Parcubacteria group bacterium]|tara:strand:+ start:1161 stop:1382 length:222 start_codon:yes stop_codon:yes gene_type:complete